MGRRSTPNAAKLEINDNLLLGEVCSRITGASGVTGRWSAKSRNINAVRGQCRRHIRLLRNGLYWLRKYGVGRKSTHTKEPDIDASLREFGDPHASSSLSKSCSITSGIRVLDNTSRVAILAVVAVRGLLGAGLGHALWLGAPRSGVERHLVVGGQVDSLKDVDLATCDGRIRTRSPCCGNTNRQAKLLQHHDSSMLPIRCI